MDLQLSVSDVIGSLPIVTQEKQILVVGRTGSGKSALINSLMSALVPQEGQAMAKEGGGIKGCTSQIMEYRAKYDNIDLTIWESPGLQDGTEKQEQYLQQLKEKCFKQDLTIYCTRMSDIRFSCGDDNSDMLAMTKLTELLGAKIWKNAIIALTYANLLESLNIDWEDLPEKEKAEAFEVKVEEWEEQIKEVMIQDLHIPEEIVDSVRVVPAGHYKKPNLPGHSSWLSNFLLECFKVISSPKNEALSSEIRQGIEKEDSTKKEFGNNGGQEVSVWGEYAGATVAAIATGEQH